MIPTLNSDAPRTDAPGAGLPIFGTDPAPLPDLPNVKIESIYDVTDLPYFFFMTPKVGPGGIPGDPNDNVAFATRYRPSRFHRLVQRLLCGFRWEDNPLYKPGK